jgi:hypothetical protein
MTAASGTMGTPVNGGQKTSTLLNLQHLLELLETAVLLTGFDQSGRRCPSNGVLGVRERQEFDAVRSNEAVSKNGARALQDHLEMNRLEKMSMRPDRRCASIRVLEGTEDTRARNGLKKGQREDLAKDSSSASC